MVTLSDNVNFLTGLQLQLKIMHWQTKGVARHLAFGDTYDELSDLIDDLVECAISKYGRFHLSEGTKTITLKNLNDIDLSELISDARKHLIEFSSQYSAEKDSDILNIRDEILAKINKLAYRLTME